VVHHSDIITRVEQDFITLASTIINPIFWVINTVVLFKLNKKSKTHDIGVEEIHELNVKMHDRLFEFEDAIKSFKYPSKSYNYPTDTSRKRLLLNASRLKKYDETILNDVTSLIDSWAFNYSLYASGKLSSDGISNIRSEMLNRINKLKVKVDKLQLR
jgi:hypothetical protein